MEKLRVVGLSERFAKESESCVRLEFACHAREVTVGEVFDALKQYLDEHRDELQRRGPESVRVSLIRSLSAGAQAWQAALH